jgi:tetratricopeptide (TPR) repeat protein
MEALFEKIESYLRGKMNPAERAAFESDMARDAALAALVQQHRLERQGLELLVERDLMAKMRAWDAAAAVQTAEMTARTGGGAAKQRPLLWLRWAAVFLLFAGGGWWASQFLESDRTVASIPSTKKEKSKKTTPPAPSSKKPDAATYNDPKPERIEAPKGIEDKTLVTIPESKGLRTQATPTPPQEHKTSEAPPASPAVDYAALADDLYESAAWTHTREQAGADEPLYGRALTSYRSGDFTQVKKLLEPALRLNKDAVKTKELLAHALYRDGRYGESVSYFSELSRSNTKSIAERADWALALALLQQMPTKQPLLEKVLDKIAATPGHLYSGKAKALKSRL